MRLGPAADQPADLVYGAGGVLVTAHIQMALLEGEAEKEPQFLQTEIGAQQMSAPVARVGRLDQRLQHVERGGLDAIAEQELL